MRPALTLARRLALGTVLAVPFAVWPGLPSPFSTPKLWVLGAGATSTLALAWVGRRGDRDDWSVFANRPVATALLGWVISVAWTAWLAPVPSSAPGLWLGLLGPAWAVALLHASPAPRHVALVGVCAGAALAGIALLQATGLDVFAMAGWAPQIEGGSTRLRVYATLGNPNFVAAWLAMQVPVAAALALDTGPRARRGLTRAALALAGVVLPCAAIVATGSRGGALALFAGVAAVAALRRPRALWQVVAASAVVVVAAVVASGARPLPQTLAGRVYIWRVLAAPAVARPVTGWGIGSIEVLYPRWEAAHHARSGDEQAGPFAGPQQHAHSDPLEALVDRGLPGAASLALVAWAVACLWRNRTAESDPAMAAAYIASLAAFAAAGLVDFPLARPAETAAAWTGVAMVAISSGRSRA